MEMGIHPITILAMVDRIFEATTEAEMKTTVEGFRRTLQGTPPSVVLQHLAIPGEEVSRTETLQQHIETLKKEVAELVTEKTNLEIEIAELQERLRQIGQIGSSVSGTAENGFYTMEQFLSVLTVKLRRSYGWRTDYVSASQQTEGCRPVANETVQKWQNTNQVPDWAVEQIPKLTFRKRTGTSGLPWSDDNETYLTELYKSDPGQSNQELARLCEEHFGRPINEPSIKGAVDRLRKKGQLPPKRPQRHRN
jgi:hypothetical protein